MKDFPIIFSGPMVQANYAGIKRMTRRVVKPVGALHIEPFLDKDGKPTGEYGWCASEHVISKHIRCPYGAPGDSIWVRETWAAHEALYDDFPGIKVRYRAGEQVSGWIPVPHRVFNRFRAERGDAKFSRWRPSIHMPLWACRNVYTVTKVRVERLHDITEEDAMAEGCRRGDKHVGENSTPAMSAKQSFMWLWQILNDKRPGASWLENPWVWVVEYDNPLWGKA